MANAPSSQPHPSPSIDPKSGYCTETKTYHSLRPAVLLPPATLPLSTASYALSLLPSPLPSAPVFVDAATGASISFSEFVSQVRSLASALRSQLGLSRGQVAFVLSPSNLHVPVLYFALLSVGVVVSPANPISTPEELSRQISLTRPSIAFAVSSVAFKIPSSLPTVVLDSPRFQSFLRSDGYEGATSVEVSQEDTAAILYSSGTTGRVKGVVLTHRNFIALIAEKQASGVDATEGEMEEGPAVVLFPIPMFHVFGFFMAVRGVALGETMVLMDRFDFGAMLRAVETYRVAYMPVSPPLVVALTKSDLPARHDLSCLRLLASGGAPLGRDVAEQFKARFPDVELVQGYGLTESAGAVSSTVGPEENKVYGSVGRIAANVEGKIVDPATGEALPPGQRGELWLRGPTIMRGYIGDDEATASTLDPEGWLKTGDLCYFNQDGFLFIVDRLKELIKYKAYQVPPAELELILQSHPEIADAAVIPYPDEDAGQIPMAFVVRQPGSKLTGEQVMHFVAKRVAPYKKVRRVAFVSSIPKSPAGKILRRELISQALSSPTSRL